MKKDDASKVPRYTSATIYTKIKSYHDLPGTVIRN